MLLCMCRDIILPCNCQGTELPSTAIKSVRLVCKAALHVQGNHPALQLLRQRAAQNSLPGDRKDKFKLGLVVEGGGMRGAVSAGSLLELGNLGFRYC